MRTPNIKNEQWEKKMITSKNPKVVIQD